MKTQNMTEGKPSSLIFKFALPLMAGNLCQEFYTIADAVIVGQFLGVKALAAVGIGGWITWMMTAAIQGFSQGFSVPVAQAFGAEDKKSIQKSMGNSIVLSVIMAAVLVILGEAILKPLLILLATPEEIFSTALLYLRIYYAGCPIMMAFNYASSHLRALGNSASPLKAMLLASVTNIGLDLLFVGPFNMGVAGAVIATLIAQFVAAIYALCCLFRIDVVCLKKEDLRLDWFLCKKLLHLGTPMSLQNIIISIGGFIVQFIVNQYGIIFIAGTTATNKLYGLIETAGISYGYAMMTYVGQNKGAGEIKRIRQGVRSANIIGIITSLVISVIMVLFGKNILQLFLTGTPEEISAAMEVGYRYLFIMSIFLSSLYVLHVLRSAIVGLGNSTIPMASGLAELGMRVVSSFMLPYYFGELNLFFAEPIAWIGAVIVLIWGYFRSMKRVFF